MRIPASHMKPDVRRSVSRAITGGMNSAARQSFDTGMIRRGLLRSLGSESAARAVLIHLPGIDAVIAGNPSHKHEPGGCVVGRAAVR